MLDVHSILEAGSLIIIALVIFAESAFLLGLLLPGDTLLIAGGVFASQHKLPLGWLIFSVIIATLLGYQVGYYIGRTAGPRIFKQKKGLLFREDYMFKTEGFFKKHGWRTVLFARFIAVVRTVVPLIAGIGKMQARTFMFFNIIGGVLWGAGLVLLSYWIGQKVPSLDSYIKYLVLIALVLTFGSVIFELVKNRSHRAEIGAALKEELSILFRRKSKDRS
ncbi:MAG TPA: DedA family protein [Candidatus Saccharimonadales bacterium]|nr:DedA family protein [Candidatus Saccharimonadales bacterium]